MLKALWKSWLVVARKIGQFQSLLILGLIYFVFIAPFALAVRLFLDSLSLRGTPSWRWLPPSSKSTTTLESMRQQS